MQLTSFILLVVMDHCAGMEYKEKVPSSDCEEDENENEYEDFNLLTFVNELSENTR